MATPAEAEEAARVVAASYPAPIRDWIASQVPGGVDGTSSTAAARASYLQLSRLAAARGN